ncbi:16S rRNA (cytidine(1402)-2'-O)-methyltransferase [Desulforhopalus sp. IMCC35007]|uniref:16S rRNA (cytidine(1402)-2'-O)-methyltransferase n=1 Tax=Desulforhopalus sp. IMCC35007 TaxID=2569543 RepID=UPI0010AE5778|nr:16S rRNA (cytidine(1402)-2'-O)-methyltransferase [Desulforhopalus sp. IMCC35007]TKB07166.1 16S rRNA (cytidine(1402)-2'-O)-methyltransferase [Desulforhopalus sp. IMCC35007]
MVTGTTNIQGNLYIIPTPIGNLEDITLRALRILKEVDLIAAEDTRHSKKLLNHYGIGTHLTSYYREKEAEKSNYLLQLITEGKNIALISDAGTPGISDPGAILVKNAHLQGITVIPLPGASAVTTAMSASGYTGDGFLFIGFPPSKKGQRQKLLTSLANSQYPVVFYESPRRIEALLEEALEVYGDRQAFWAREITKSFEDLEANSLSGLLEKAKADPNRGEFVLVIYPGQKDEVQGETIEELICWYRDNSELSLKDVSNKLAADLGISKSVVYQQALSLWNNA